MRNVRRATRALSRPYPSHCLGRWCCRRRGFVSGARRGNTATHWGVTSARIAQAILTTLLQVRLLKAVCVLMASLDYNLMIIRQTVSRVLPGIIAMTVEASNAKKTVTQSVDQPNKQTVRAMRGMLPRA